jgi:pimeloyl-ACP methyl ester carboxylesterase
LTALPAPSQHRAPFLVDGKMKAAAVDLQLDTGPLRALRLGLDSGTPVLCVPGLSANARSFDAIAARLAVRGHHVVALDLRGRGFSPPPSASSSAPGWRGHALDVLAAAAKLGYAAFDLIGHSMGAFVSMQAAALEPARIRRLVLIDGVGVPEPAAIPPILAGVQRLGVACPTAEAYCELIRNRGVAVPWEELWKDHYLYELQAVEGGVMPRTSREAVLADVLYGSKQDARLFWPGLSMPTLLVRAAQPLLPGSGFIVGTALRDDFLAAVPSAQAVEVDANHFGVMAHREALQAIDDFLGRDGRP